MCFFFEQILIAGLLILSRPEFLWSQSMDKAIDYVNMVHAVYLDSFASSNIYHHLRTSITFRTDFQTTHQYEISIWI